MRREQASRTRVRCSSTGTGTGTTMLCEWCNIEETFFFSGETDDGQRERRSDKQEVLNVNIWMKRTERRSVGGVSVRS